jgi:putative oligomerization/nucleic acid binding protein
MQPPERLPDPSLRSVLLLAVGVAGVALCITIVYLAMRAVMDIGGACADGGPYVSANPCPDGVPLAMILSIFGLFLFGGLGMAGAGGVGGYGWLPILAWTGLFASLGWNFLDYGLLNPPEGEGILWGYVIPGVLFQVMAWVPIAILVWGLRSQRRWRADAAATTTLRGPGQPARAASSTVDNRPPPVPASHRFEEAGSGRTAELEAIDAAMGALVVGAASHAPVSPASPSVADGTGGRQALLAHLERLGEMRDKGQLTAEEFDAAKDAVMQELEALS